MGVLTIRLFGQLQVQQDDQVLDGWNSRKGQELLAYLLLHRERTHTRQALADLLWPESSTEQSMKYLRHTLWRLQTVLDHRIQVTDPESLGLNLKAGLWLDVLEFEQAYARVQGISGDDLDGQRAQIVQEALNLYRGDLLEGWYQDWCLFERERLQRMYLSLLEKQMAYCETHGKYELGLECGTCALRYDVAHERIHRRLMRLYYLAGDRTAALRQYERCVALLREELGVDPSERTVALYRQIRSGRLVGHSQAIANRNGRTSQEAPPALEEALHHLKQLQMTVAKVDRRLQEAIYAVESALNGHQ
ncbi:MAG: BTAD domain-containing putative transcriptional regulator [Anaerolineae bacterium]|jgi:DNA-binding SARP family transcriptional activator